MSAPESFQSRVVVVVVQPANVAAFSKPICTFDPSARLPVINCASEIMRPPFGQFGVGHEPQSLSDMRRTEARSRDTGRCDGVTDSFQVSLNKVEPAVADRCFNLFTKDCLRFSLLDEIEPGGPEVSLITGALLLSGGAEWLAGAASGPHWLVIWPSGEPQGVAPDSDAGEEMALCVSGKIVCSDILDAPFVHVAGRNVAGGDKVPQPLRGVGVDLVIVGAHAFPFLYRSRFSTRWHSLQ